MNGITAPVQNLLGINNFDEAAGFWTDNNGHEHGFVVQIDTQSLSSSTFIEIPPTTFAGAVATQASDITNNKHLPNRVDQMERIPNPSLCSCFKFV